MDEYPAYTLIYAEMIAQLSEEDQELLALLQDFLEASPPPIQEEPDPTE